MQDPGTRDAHILIVDDDAAFAETVANGLTTLGWQTTAIGDFADHDFAEFVVVHVGHGPLAREVDLAVAAELAARSESWLMQLAELP